MQELAPASADIGARRENAPPGGVRLQGLVVDLHHGFTLRDQTEALKLDLLAIIGPLLAENLRRLVRSASTSLPGHC